MNNVFNNAKFIKAKGYSKEFSLYDPLAIFRREFNIDSDIKTAIITVTIFAGATLSPMTIGER